MRYQILIIVITSLKIMNIKSFDLNSIGFYLIIYIFKPYESDKNIPYKFRENICYPVYIKTITAFE